MGKARKFSSEFKAQVVLEIVSGRKSLALTSREYQIKNMVLSRWKAQFLEGAPGIFEAGRPAEEKRLRARDRLIEQAAALAPAGVCGSVSMMAEGLGDLVPSTMPS